MKIIAQFLCSQSAAVFQYLKVSFSIACLIFLKKTIFSHRISQTLSLMIRMSNILYLSLTKYACSPPIKVTGVFLDISKAFDKVWHDGIIWKLKRNGINGNLFRLIKTVLSDRCKRVALNDKPLTEAKLRLEFL